MPRSSASVTIIAPRNRVSPSLRAVVRSAITRNERVFGRRTAEVKVIVCDNRREMKEACGYYYHPLARGLVMRNGTIVVRSFNYSGISRAAYRQMIAHEMNHLFWLHRFGRPGNLWNPLWVCEGLAVMTAKNSYLIPRDRLKLSQADGTALLHYRYRPKALKTRAAILLLYSLWTHFLADAFGNDPKAVVRFLDRALRRGGARHFEKTWSKRFGRSLDQSLKRFTAGISR